MIHAKSFYVDTTKGVDLILIGHEVRAAIRESKAEKGWVSLLLPRPGCGIITIETAERNGLAVERGQARLLPKSLVVPFEKGKIAFDPWQEVFVVDYEDSGRRREVMVQVWGEEKPPPQPGAGGLGR